MASTAQLYDGFQSLEGGMDGGLPPQLIARNQVAMAVNCTFRGNYVSPRPPFLKHALTIPAGAATLFSAGKFQAAGYYAPDGGDPKLCVAIDGHVLLVDVLNSYTVEDISIATDYNSTLPNQGWFCQAGGKYLLYQDGLSACFIHSAGHSRRSNPEQSEVPVGTCMGFGLGRLVVALASPMGRHYVLGDIEGGGSEVIQFTENDFLNEGGDFVTQGSTGDITGFAYPVNLNTALGESNLCVFTPDAVYYNVVPLDRTEWKNLQMPLQVVGLLGSGSYSPVITNVNSDLWFRARDGVRSLGMSVRNFGDWGDTPMSHELEFLLDTDTEWLLNFHSQVRFDNRLLVTCSPVQTERGVYHQGLVVIDFAPLTSLTKKLAPHWEGIWTGLHVLKIVTGTFNRQERCFLWCLRGTNIELWELLKSGYADNDDGITSTPIQWWFELPKYAFGYPYQFKQLEKADCWIDKVAGNVSLAVQFRHDEDPIYHDWFSWADCAPLKQCGTVDGCLPNQQALPQWRYNVTIPQPPNDCDTIAGRPNRTGYLFQPRIAVTGYCQFKGFRMNAAPLPQEISSPCPSVQPCRVLNAFAQYRL